MNMNIDWKMVDALGVLIIGTILVAKLDSTSAEKVAILFAEALADNIKLLAK